MFLWQKSVSVQHAIYAADSTEHAGDGWTSAAARLL